MSDPKDARIAELEARLSENAAYFAELHETVQKATARIADLETALAEAKEDITELEGCNEGYGKVIDVLEKREHKHGRWRIAEQSTAERVAQTCDRMEAAEATVARLTAELREADDNYATCQDLLAQKKADLAAALRRIDERYEYENEREVFYAGVLNDAEETRCALQQQRDHAEAERASLTTLLHQVRAQLSNGGGVGHIIAAIDERVKP